MTRDLEELYVQIIVHHNIGVLLRDDYKLNPGTVVQVYNTSDKMKKKRSTLSKDIYEVVGYQGTAIELRNTSTGEIVYRARWQVSILE